MQDQLPEEEKKRRLNEVNRVQSRISAEINKALVGKTCEILIDGLAPKGKGLLQGRTATDKVVIVEGPESMLGRMVKARIDQAGNWYLFGSLLPEKSSAVGDASRVG
jgi:tRNA-2-methylthio-N6-dimethylallyladenosine synthase